MAELLVRIVDRGNTPLHAKAGEVVTAQRDGWQWTATERSNPEWVILRLPGMDPARFADMVMPAPVDSGVTKDATFDAAHAEFRALVARAAAAPQRLLALTDDECARLLKLKRATQNPRKVTL
jgi:hypothetical protein